MPNERIMAMTDRQARNMTGSRKLSSAKTFDRKTLKPISGGLFDNDATGFNSTGDRWSYFELPEPVLNPMMEKPVQLILDMTSKDLHNVISGNREYRGKRGGEALKEMLGDININNEMKKASQTIKDGPASKADKAVRKYRALKALQNNDTRPEEYMMSRIPVVPPKHRPIKKMDDMTLVADLNYMYKNLFNAVEDFNEVSQSDVPEEIKEEARENLYNKYKELTGLMKPSDPKLKEEGVGGILQQLFGKDRTKDSMVKRRVLETNIDLAGLGVIAPDPSLTLNQVGLPEEQAWKIYEPFIVRDMVKKNVPATEAARRVEERHPKAYESLQRVVKERPLIINRAPTLHKYSLFALEPRLDKGNTIKIPPQIVGPLGADHDGDTASLSLPVSKAAVEEARAKMMPSQNLLSDRDNKPLFVPDQEYAEGLYYMSKDPESSQKPVTFPTAQKMKESYSRGEIGIDTPIQISKNNKED